MGEQPTRLHGATPQQTSPPNQRRPAPVAVPANGLARPSGGAMPATAPAGTLQDDVPGLPPLLPWHVCLLALFTGCLSWQAPWYGVPAWMLLLLYCRDLLGGPGQAIKLGCFALSLAAGAWMALAAQPDAQQPGWLTQRMDVQLQGTIVSRSGLPGDRLRFILEDVHLTTPANATLAMDGRIAWTWDNPPVMLPGDATAGRDGAASAASHAASGDRAPSRLPAPHRGLGQSAVPRPPPELGHTADLTAGTRLRANLRLYPIGGFQNFGSDSSASWWALQGVIARAYSWGEKAEVTILAHGHTLPSLRARLQTRVETFLDRFCRIAGETAAELSSQGGAMVLALTFGDRQFLENADVDLLRRASLAHTIALSGAHVGCVVGLGWVAAWALGWIWPGAYLHWPRRKWGALFGMCLAAGYVWLGGATPSLLRAALMFGVWCVFLWRGRQAVILDGLCIAVAILLLASPEMALDLRLQLSVAAVAGIACYAGLMARFVSNGSSRAGLGRLSGRALSMAGGLLAVSLAAQAALLPLQLWHFGEVHTSLWANALWLPLLGSVVIPTAILGVLFTALETVLPVVGPVASGALFLSAQTAEAMLNGLAWIDGRGWLTSQATIRPHWGVWLGWWGILCYGVIRMAAGRTSRWQRGGLTLSLLLLAIGLAPTLFPATGMVTLTTLDVGQGQALVLEGPDGSQALIDGGGFRSRRFDPGRGIVMPALAWHRRPSLELVLATHHDVDHLRGCYYAISHLGPRAFFSNGGEPGPDWDKARLAEALHKGGLEEQALTAGDVLRLGDPDHGLRLTVLHPFTRAEGSDNDGSLVLRVDWQGQPLAMIPGDLETKGLNALVAARSPDDLKASAMILAHHGAVSSHSEAFLDAVNPAVAVASAGQFNQWKFPSPEVCEAVACRSIPFFVTARDGAIRLEWDTPTSPPRVVTARGE